MFHRINGLQGRIIAPVASLIVLHNRPNGNPTPSLVDKRITERLAESGKLIGTNPLEHAVGGDNRWVSPKQIGAF